MKHQWILLTPINPEFFGQTLTAGIMNIERAFCDVLSNSFPRGITYYVTSPDRAFLEAFCQKHSLEGLVVESRGIYDNIIQDELILEDNLSGI